MKDMKGNEGHEEDQKKNPATEGGRDIGFQGTRRMFNGLL
jgi:hypothetical protein